MIETLKKLDATYEEGMPLLSDTDYDVFKKEAKDLYPDDPYFKTVGTSPSSKEVKLPYVMGSLDKIGPDDIKNWIEKHGTIVAEEKLDGVSILIKWVDGKPVFGATRGDGITGQDISDKIKYFVPEIPIKGTVMLRGEATLTNDSHTILGFKNRRNGVAGLIRRDDIDPSKLKMVVPKFYEILEAPEKLDTELETIQYIRVKLNLDGPVYYDYDVSLKDINNIDFFINNLNNHLKYIKEENEYDIDGFVLVVNESQRQNVKIPTNKIAYKVNEEAIKVTVKDVEWNLSKGGKLIPTVLIEPVEMNGATISRATGFNALYISDNSIGHGAIVGLLRSGEIIPYITEVFVPAKYINIPSTCPVCSNNLSGKGVDIVCTNVECLLSNSKRIAYFFKTLGSDFITETTIENLGITNIEQMYELEELDFLDKEGFGLKRGEQIVNEVQKTLRTSPEKLIAAFSIPTIGVEIATKIMNCVNTFEELFNLTYDQLSDIIGPKTIEKFVININSYRSLYDFLVLKGLTFKEKTMGEYTGKQFALTGSGPIKRDQLIKMIQAKGGSVNAVSKNTNYLVAENPDGNSTKLQRAKKYGTIVISYEKLINMMEG